MIDINKCVGGKALMQDGLLSYFLIEREALTQELIDRMFSLMESNYDFVNKEAFTKDLNNKQYIGLITNELSDVVGFTTFAINPKNTGTADYNIIFSGDTILDPDHWGTQIVSKGWNVSVGLFCKSDPGKKWYWYLMSKGHRTYMYLPLFFESFYPSIVPSEVDEVLRNVADSVSSKLYGAYWQKEQGIIEFPQNQGALKNALVDDSFKKSKSPNIAFFLEKNPGFHKGDELVCITEISAANLKRSMKDYFLMGYNGQF